MILLGLWFILIFVFSVIPVSGPETDLPGDKVAHVIMYAFTSLLLFRYFSGKKQVMSAFYVSVAVSGLYGAAMEIVQYFLPHRSFCFADMAANVLGAFLGSLLYMKLRNRKKEFFSSQK